MSWLIPKYEALWPLTKSFPLEGKNKVTQGECEAENKLFTALRERSKARKRLFVEGKNPPSANSGLKISDSSQENLGLDSVVKKPTTVTTLL